jgi:hypothetical protein
MLVSQKEFSFPVKICKINMIMIVSGSINLNKCNKKMGKLMHLRSILNLWAYKMKLFPKFCFMDQNLTHKVKINNKK